MIDDSRMQKLTTGAQRLVQLALQKKQEHHHSYLGVNHWMLALVERHAPMIESMVPGFDLPLVGKILPEQLQRGEYGQQLEIENVLSQAEARAAQRNKMQASERDLAFIILTAGGYKPSEGDALPIISRSDFPPINPTPTPTGPASESAPVATPTLDQFGRDLTRAAREGKLSSIVGRENEIQLVIETLCRRTKRNPALIGPAGVGKTAIAEGLALQVIQGGVPDMLANVRIIAIQPSTLIAGASMAGEMEKRVQAVLKEASQAGIILFIDEIHTIMGAGGIMGATDMSSLLKPALARGDMAVIAATTDDEYRKFIENDKALERRFQPIRINELSPDQTFEILQVLKVELSKRYKINVEEDVLHWLVSFADQYMRNRHFPDKAVDLLEQCYAHAVTQDKTVIQMEDAQDVAQRMVGMPLALDERLSKLQETLQGEGLLYADQINVLINRLQVTLRGLDLRSSKPNAMICLCGEARQNSEALAESLALCLFGAKDRVITIDLSRFTESHDISLLVGAPPGYVGYSDSLPLHRLEQTPWCVVRFENVDACHPFIRETLAQAFSDGVLMDGRGRPMHFADTIVLLTADIQYQASRSMGFLTKDDSEIEQAEVEKIWADATRILGEEIANQLDMLVFTSHSPEGPSKEWLKDHLLMDITERYRKQGMKLVWDDTIIEYLASAGSILFTETEWERWVDRELTPAILPFLPKLGAKSLVEITIRFDNGKIMITEAKKGEA